MTLELSVVAENGARIDLPNFLPWQNANSAANDSEAFAMVAARAPAKTGRISTRKVAAKAAPAKRATAAKYASSAPKTKTTSSRKHTGVLQKA
jgi:topoisomerase IA-like protein